MKNQIIVQDGGLGLRLIRSPLYLDDTALTGRINLMKGSLYSLSEQSEPAHSLPAIHYFSIPRHLFERLWLEEIPVLTNMAAPSPEPVRHDHQWRGLDMLSVMLETIEDGFGKPVEAIFQSSIQVPEGTEISDSDICTHAAQSLQNSSEPKIWRFGAWLNLDDASHFAQVRLREPEKNNWSQEPITLEIGQGEGILWPRRELQMTEMKASSKEISNKLVLLGGNGSLV